MTSMAGRNSSNESSLACDLLLNSCMSKHADVVSIGLWEVSTLVDIGEVSVIEVRALAVILIQKMKMQLDMEGCGCPT